MRQRQTKQEMMRKKQLEKDQKIRQMNQEESYGRKMKHIDQGEGMPTRNKSKEKAEQKKQGIRQLDQEIKQLGKEIESLEKLQNAGEQAQQNAEETANFIKQAQKILETSANYQTDENGQNHIMQIIQRQINSKRKLLQQKQKRLQQKKQGSVVQLQLLFEKTQKQFYSRDSSQSDTFQKYKKLIQDYKTFVETFQAPQDYEDLFQWVRAYANTYQSKLQGEIQLLTEAIELRNKGKFLPIENQQEADSQFVKRKKYLNRLSPKDIQQMAKALNAKGPKLMEEYIKDIKSLLKGGFLIDVRINQNKILIADLFSYGFREREDHFFAQPLSQMKKAQYYTPATIKPSCIKQNQAYLVAADEAIKSLRECPKLLSQIEIFLKMFQKTHEKADSLGPKVTPQSILEGLREAEKSYGFFDYGFRLNGITVCKQQKLRIYFNTYQYRYNQKSRLELFKSFVFFIYLHQIIHYLVRYLNIVDFQSHSMEMDDDKYKQFKKELEREKVEKESGLSFEQYLFGEKLDFIHKDDYEKYIEAQKGQEDLLKYFKRREEHKKDNPKPKNQTHRCGRQDMSSQSQLIYRLEGMWCGNGRWPPIKNDSS